MKADHDSLPPLIGVTADFVDVSDAHGSGEFHRLRPAYADALLAAGAAPVVLPPVPDAEMLAHLVDRLDGLVLSGSDDYPAEASDASPDFRATLCHPRRTVSDLALARLLPAAGLPVLGICGGMQLLALGFGGRIVQHLETADMHRTRNNEATTRHEILIAEDSRLRMLAPAARLSVNSSHHQGVDPSRPGEGLRITARSAADGTPEALELPGERFLIGVQWHPERNPDETLSVALFRAFVDAARDHLRLTERAHQARA